MMLFSNAQLQGMNLAAAALAEGLVETEKYQFASVDKEVIYVLKDGMALKLKVSVESVTVVTE